MNHIRCLFSANDERIVLFIDALCFIVKASDARLMVSQRYIFNSIMSFFGKDIESNLCTMITFADGGSPTVLDSLKEFKLPFKLTFNFNNLALFTDNRDLKRNMSAALFWEMSYTSFNNFFKLINYKKSFLNKRCIRRKGAIKNCSTAYSISNQCRIIKIIRASRSFRYIHQISE